MRRPRELLQAGRHRRVRLLAALLACAPDALVLADARAPALLAFAPFTPSDVAPAAAPDPLGQTRFSALPVVSVPPAARLAPASEPSGVRASIFEGAGGRIVACLQKSASPAPRQGRLWLGSGRRSRP